MLHVSLPLADRTVWAPAVIGLGFGVGVLTGLFGVGGGFLLTPALRVLLGIPYPVAVGSGLVPMIGGGLTSAWRHGRAGNVDGRLGVTLAAGAMAGAETGRRLMGLLTGPASRSAHGSGLLDLVLDLLFLLLLAAVSVIVLRDATRPPTADGTEEHTSRFARALHRIRIAPVVAFPASGIAAMSLWVPVLASFAVGILTGLMGVGGGFVMFPLLVYGLGVPTLRAVGTGALQVVFAAGYGAFSHATAGHVEPWLAVLLLAGTLPGVHLGVALSGRLGAHRLRRWFALVLLAGMVLVLYHLACLTCAL